MSKLSRGRSEENMSKDLENITSEQEMMTSDMNNENMAEQALQEEDTKAPDMESAVEPASEEVFSEAKSAEESEAFAENPNEPETEEASLTGKKRPTVTQLEQELGREEGRHKFGRVLRSTIYALIVVAAVAVLIATLVLPVLKIYGNSMAPTLEEGEIVVALKRSSFETGDIIAFYYNNRILVKRVICGAGDWFDMDEDGNVYVNGERIDEPYVKELSYETCDLELPYQVPDGLWFVMGDHRATSVDSRSSIVGCVGKDQIVGKIFVNVWPLDRMRIIKHN